MTKNFSDFTGLNENYLIDEPSKKLQKKDKFTFFIPNQTVKRHFSIGILRFYLPNE